MKKYLKIVLTALLVFVVFTLAAAPHSIKAHVDPITYQDFYDDLSAYGTWILYPGYGHVWSPTLDAGFEPYLTNGYWEYTNEGWMWQSEYAWGWAPFHYGTWLNDNSYGWLWVPGYEWSPAWVTWGDFKDYYAWAPLSPNVNNQIPYREWKPADADWYMVRNDNIADKNVSNEILDFAERKQYFGQINLIDNFHLTKNNHQYYSGGPEIGEVERFTQKRIKPMPIIDADKNETSIDENGVNVYRPVVIHAQPHTYKRMEESDKKPTARELKTRPMMPEHEEQVKRMKRMENINSPENTYGPERRN